MTSGLGDCSIRQLWGDVTSLQSLFSFLHYPSKHLSTKPKRRGVLEESAPWGRDFDHLFAGKVHSCVWLDIKDTLSEADISITSHRTNWYRRLNMKPVFRSDLCGFMSRHLLD
ncbi:unnamed protein product [Natator depressus]